MDFGVVVSRSWSAKQIVESAKVADEVGLDFLLITDHYMTPRSNQSVDSWTMLAALAVKTEKIQLGTCVTPITFRPPQMLAKIVATVDQLSNGRAILGVGAGWNKQEFVAYSSWDDVKVRVAKTREAIELILKLWLSSGPVDFDGKYYKIKGAILEPKPIREPHPPLWFGAGGPYMLKLAKRYGDGWVPPPVLEGPLLDPKVLAQTYRMIIKTLKADSTRDGKRPIKVTFNGTLKELRQMLPEFEKLGFDGAILARESPEEMQHAIRLFAKEIIPSYRQR
jgi:alkanesulfonate monooxygenase SsuD/methylene tetrahydromethanopterin reductase-like flavin-dependent oxidoreductase (luciferase family)